MKLSVNPFSWEPQKPSRIFLPFRYPLPDCEHETRPNTSIQKAPAEFKRDPLCGSGSQTMTAVERAKLVMRMRGGSHGSHASAVLPPGPSPHGNPSNSICFSANDPGGKRNLFTFIFIFNRLFFLTICVLGPVTLSQRSPAFG